MTLRRLFLILSLLGMIVPIALILHAMGQVGWDFAQAGRDLDAFARSVFGQVVLSGYFISGLSLTCFIAYEASARADDYLYWTLPILVIFGIGAALPFYLYLRLPRQE